MYLSLQSILNLIKNNLITLLTTLVITVCLCETIAYAQTPRLSPTLPAPTSSPDENRLTIETIINERKNIRAQIDELKKVLEELKTPPKESEEGEVAPQSSISKELIDLKEQQLQILERIDLILSRQSNALKQTEAFIADHNQLEDQLEQLRVAGLSEKPTFLLMDNLRNELEAEEEKLSSIENNIKTAINALDQAGTQLEEKNNARNLAKEKLDKTSDDTTAPLLTAKWKLAQLESQAARETMVLRELELQNQHLAKTVYETKLVLLRERLERVESQALFLQSDLQEQIDKLHIEKVQLEKEKQTAQVTAEGAEKAIAITLDKLAKAGDSVAIKEEVRTRQFELRNAQEEISLLNDRIGRLQEQETIWRRRYDVYNRNATIEQLQKWREESQQNLDSLKSQERISTAEINTYRKEIVTLEEKSERFKDDKAVTAQLEKQRELYIQRIRSLNYNLTSIETTRRLHNKLLEEINQQIQTWSLAEVLEFIGIQIERLLNTGWNFGKADDSQAFITVRKILIALCYLIVGIMVARFLSRKLVPVFLNRVGGHEGATDALQSLSYYFFLLFVALLTLNAINVPLTAFTFLGGALAIGIGFGSQNILNNFISGLILLIERPIRVGDIVEVEGNFGTVSRIGARCTQILTFTNIDLMVPNSMMLENRVTNWTLSDRVIRREVNVGVAYGTELREVFRILRKAIDEHGLVLRKPEPFITFANFGDHSLEFYIRYFVEVHDRINALTIDSDIRHRIYNLFDEAGIVIAFPQQDVHLDTTHPLDVRIIQPDEQSDESSR